MATLITGASGFVGLCLAEELILQQQNIVLLDQQPPPQIFLDKWKHLISKNLHIELGDVTELSQVERVFSEYVIDRVFHGAAITSGFDRELNHADQIFKVNLLGTINVVNASSRAKVKRFIYPSSLTVYGQCLYDLDEVDELLTPALPDSIYSISKYAAERSVLRLSDRLGLNSIIVRIGSVFGPWEYESGVRDLISPFAQISKLFVQRREVILPCVYPRRELIYNKDLAICLATLLKTNLISNARENLAYNLSNNTNWNNTLIDFCSKLKTIYPSFEWQLEFKDKAPNIVIHDPRDRASLNSKRLYELIGFKPVFTQDLALADYSHWISENVNFFL